MAAVHCNKHTEPWQNVRCRHCDTTGNRNGEIGLENKGGRGWVVRLQYDSLVLNGMKANRYHRKMSQVVYCPRC